MSSHSRLGRKIEAHFAAEPDSRLPRPTAQRERGPRHRAYRVRILCSINCQRSVEQNSVFERRGVGMRKSSNKN